MALIKTKLQVVTFNGFGLLEGIGRNCIWASNMQILDGRDDLGEAAASGVYLYRLEMPGLDLAQTRSMTLPH